MKIELRNANLKIASLENNKEILENEYNEKKKCIAVKEKCYVSLEEKFN
jgi:hypothetical protein